MKHIKKFNEATISFNDGDYETNDYYKELFTSSNYNTEITIDIDYYVDIAFKQLFEYCEEYDLKPSKEIITELVVDVKLHTEEYVLYSDQDGVSWDSEYSFIIDNLKYMLKTKQPEEYKKITIKDNAKKFKL